MSAQDVGGTDLECACFVKAAVAYQHVAMRIKLEQIAECLNSDDCARCGGGFLACGALIKCFQRFPGAAAQIREQAAIIEEVTPQNFWYAENNMAVRNFLNDFHAQPLTKLNHPFLMT